VQSDLIILTMNEQVSLLYHSDNNNILITVIMVTPATEIKIMLLCS